jgi:hypothetical protein
MPKSKLAKNKTSTSTQQYLDIAEIRDDIVILKDGGMRAVLLASSVNFALKSEDEQNAIIQSYIMFLNSLDFPIQIVIQSRQLNMDKYLEELKVKQKEQTNELLSEQIGEYYQYIKELITLGEIMSKRFYIVVPYSVGDKKNAHKGFFAQVGTVISPAKLILLSDKLFNQNALKLRNRVEKVASGLAGLGVTGVQLNTQSLIELYYNSYNPELSQSQKLPDEKQLKVDE